MMVALDSFLDYVAVMAGDCVDFLTVTLSLILTSTATLSVDGMTGFVFLKVIFC